MNVWLTINLVRAGEGPSLPEWAAHSYAQEVSDSEYYGPPRYSTYPLAPGVDAHAAQFQHTVFEDSEPYARRLQLLAIKQCSAAWDCYASIWTVDANRKASDTGIRLIMETVRFADRGFVLRSDHADPAGVCRGLQEAHYRASKRSALAGVARAASTSAAAVTQAIATHATLRSPTVSRIEPATNGRMPPTR